MAPTMDSEKELIARILAGDSNLFHELIRPYEKMVFVTIFAMVRNEAEAEDGAQETMISAFRHLKSFRGESKFSTWLIQITVNEARMRQRKQRADVFEGDGSLSKVHVRRGRRPVHGVAERLGGDHLVALGDPDDDRPELVGRHRLADDGGDRPGL